jgi:hypothetical protein
MRIAMAFAARGGWKRGAARRALCESTLQPAHMLGTLPFESDRDTNGDTRLWRGPLRRRIIKGLRRPIRPASPLLQH